MMAPALEARQEDSRAMQKVKKKKRFKSETLQRKKKAYISDQHISSIKLVQREKRFDSAIFSKRDEAVLCVARPAAIGDGSMRR